MEDLQQVLVVLKQLIVQDMLLMIKIHMARLLIVDQLQEMVILELFTKKSL
jgi:hypothetical protein